MAEGAFDNLRGKGQPLKLDENPYEDPAWRTAYRVLRNAGYSLPWIESAREIENEVQTIRRDLASAWAARRADETWQSAVRRFETRLGGLNKKIRDHNLEVPAPQFQIPLLNLTAEYRKITGTEAE